MRKAYVIGASMNRWGKMDDTAREAMIKSGLETLEIAGMDPKNVDTSYISNVFSVAENQGHIGPIVNNGLGMYDAPSLAVESACASGSAAFHEAYVHVAGGFDDAVLVIGCEKVTHMDLITSTSYFALGCDAWFEAANGITFPGLYAVMANYYMNKYNLPNETLGKVAVKNHANAVYNPHAHFQKNISLDDYFKSRMIAAPFRMYDCCPFSDGAASALVVSEKWAKEAEEKIEIIGAARAGSIYTMHERPDPCSINAAVLAGRKAIKHAGLGLKDIDLFEVHDCFTIAEIVATEDLGLFERGKGGDAVEEGITQKDGNIPVNPSGGLKAKGHPVGATGVGQVVEMWEQLRGEAGKRQVDGAEIGLAHNIGATGASCGVHIFRRA